MDYQKSQKKITKFYCEMCDYSTSHKNDFNKHLLTIKHINAKWITKNPKNSQQDNDNKNYCNNEFFECTCGKKYKYKQGLYKHKKTCILLIDISNSNESNNASISNDIVENKSIISNDMIIKLINENNEIKNTLIQENKELRNQINTLIPKIGTNIKQKFNINVFLNEKCKDAINMSDFIKSIQVSLEQLDFTKTQGLEKGIKYLDSQNYLLYTMIALSGKYYQSIKRKAATDISVTASQLTENKQSIFISSRRPVPCRVLLRRPVGFVLQWQGRARSAIRCFVRLLLLGSWPARLQTACRHCPRLFAGWPPFHSRMPPLL